MYDDESYDESDVYSGQSTTKAVENDEIDPEEEGFMKGYEKDEIEEKKKKEDEDIEDEDDEETITK